MPEAQNPANQDLANLDFLRAVAVLLVLVGHLSHFQGVDRVGPFGLLWMGTLGVIIFFVHTALVLMFSLERQWSELGRHRLFRVFMIRRIFRIYPLSLAIVLAIVLLHLPLGSVHVGYFESSKSSASAIVANLLLIQNVRQQPSVLGPLWSLPYEIQMYLTLPWLFLLIRPNRLIWRIALTYAGTIGVCLLLNSGILSGAKGARLGYAPCFLAGLVAYQLQRKWRNRLPALLWPIGVIAAVLAYLYGANPSGEHWVKKWIMCLVLAVGIPFFAQLSARWLVVPSRLIAKYSYGIYLTHFFCIWFAFDKLGAHSAVLQILVFATLAVGFPVLLFHVLEQPMIRFGKKAALRRFAQISPAGSRKQAVTDSQADLSQTPGLSGPTKLPLA